MPATTADPARAAQPLTPIHGEVAPGFEPVRDAFAANFQDPREIGAACAVWHRGRMVVDIWAGARDRATGAPWERETLVGFFSVTKGIASMAIALLHSRGLIEWDAPVAAYWPEFAQRGKDRITVRRLLTHQAGLIGVDEPVTVELLQDPDRLAAALARQRPAWEPGQRHGYHAVTLGWYQGELLRRVDPQRRTIGRFVREELAGPLGVEFHIGAPRDLHPDRLAEIQDFRISELLYKKFAIPMRLLAGLFVPWGLPARAFLNPKVQRPADLVRPPLLYTEMPSSNGVGTARAVARLYGAFATGGAELGIGRRTIADLEAPQTPPARGEHDLVLKMNVRYGLGFAKPFDTFRFGTSGRAYGTAGLGGSIGLADPDTQTGYAYVPNRSGFHLWDDPRERRIREAMYRCVGASS